MQPNNRTAAHVTAFLQSEMGMEESQKAGKCVCVWGGGGGERGGGFGGLLWSPVGSRGVEPNPFINV